MAFVPKHPQIGPIKARQRSDGELYARPYPNPFSDNWIDGFHDGLEQHPAEPLRDIEYRDGYRTGVDEAEYRREEANRVGSSNS